MIGSTLGPYEITAAIGAGGMGEVYRAHDTKLKRDVALKVLPEAFASDRDRMARFEREAQLLATLNHPHIAGIYGLEESGPTRAIVMELVEGPTLADRIARGPIHLPEALQIARQIAEGLEAAHDAGVIHRDLKPANIKVRSDGVVKLLDFGLAKAVKPIEASAELGESSTVTMSDMTAAGVIVGTAAYMSPEQARGDRVDKRTDLWALGCILYEMLCGRKAFAGETGTDTLAAVLKTEPDMTALPNATPEVIRRLLRRCLAKDPRRRLREAGSALVEIEEVIEEPSVASPELAAGVRHRQRPLVSGMLAAALVVAVGLATWAWLRTPSPSPHFTPRFALTLPASERMLSRAGDVLALSPDGSTLIYGAFASGQLRLFRRPLDQFRATRIDGTGGALSPFLSPDGTWIGYSTLDALYKLALTGGQPHRLTMLPAGTLGIRGADWGAKGSIVFGLNGKAGSPLMQVSAAGGQATTLFTPDATHWAWYPEILPDGDWVLFTLSQHGPDTGEIDAVNRRTGEQRTVLRRAAKGRVLPTGHLVFVRGGSLWAVPFNSRRLEPVGNPAPIVEGVRVEAGGAVDYAVAADGTLAYLSALPAGSGSKQVVWIDRQGHEQPLSLPPRNYQAVSLSPDGTRAAFQIGQREDADIWVSDLQRGTLARITDESGLDGAPLWSPDGREIVFLSEHEGRRQLMSKAADGTGAARIIATFGSDVLDARADCWSADGSELLTTRRTAATHWDIGTITREGGAWKPLINSSAAEIDPALSPDGRWLAYSADDTGKYEVYIQRFPSLGSRQQISVGGGYAPSWSADGREILYLRSRDEVPDAVMRVSLGSNRPGESRLHVGTPEALFDFSTRHYFAVPNTRFLAVGGDHRRLLAFVNTDEEDPTQRSEIDVVLNWFDEVQRAVPRR